MHREVIKSSLYFYSHNLVKHIVPYSMIERMNIATHLYWVMEYGDVIRYILKLLL